MAAAPAPAPAPTHRRVNSGGRSNEASRSPRRGSLAGRRGSARRGSALLTTGYAAMFGREDRNVSSTNLLRLARAGRVRRRDWVALGARAWEAVCLLLCIYSMIVVPFGLAFWSEYPVGAAAWDTVAEALLLADVARTLASPQTAATTSHAATTTRSRRGGCTSGGGRRRRGSPAAPTARRRRGARRGRIEVSMSFY